MRIIKIALVAIAILLNGALSRAGEAGMNITSPVFGDHQEIPQKYTCQGQDINPPLQLSGIPDGTKSLALIVDDPDAPSKTWVHWVVFNIPVAQEIKENSTPGSLGFNDFGRNNWGGPCPPSGKHRYFFKAYALDSTLGLKEGAKKQDLEAAMQGHTLAQAQLIGLYQKK
jgi:Raf kinase inhibitor-like YbhB/YbcL family protein